MGKKIQTFTTIDDLTGEVREQYSVFTSAGEGEQAFVKVYLNSDVDVFSLSKTESFILRYIARRSSASPDRPEVIFNIHSKRDVAKQLGCTVGNVTYALSNLVRAKVLLHVGTSAYQLNPYVLGKGTWRSIKELRARLNAKEKEPIE